MKIRLGLHCVLAITVLFAAVPLAALDTVKFDQELEQLKADLGVPGVSVGIFEAGAKPYFIAHGVADDSGQSITADTVFQLGSVSKSFTALVVNQLAAEQLISLDDPVSKYIPEFGKGKQKEWRNKITVKHLLNHRSGFSMLDGNQYQFTSDRSSDATLQSVLNTRKYSIAREPGSSFEYSNANYAVAAHLIERVTAQPFEQVLSSRIFKPLGMSNTFVQKTNMANIVSASGYRQWFGLALSTDFVAGRMMMGAGGVVSSARDLLTYVQAIAEADERIMPQLTKIALASPQFYTERDAYSMGWFIDDGGASRIVYHGGLNSGFASKVAFSPEQQKGVVILTNLSGSLQGDLVGAVTNKALGLKSVRAYPSTLQKVLLWGPAVIAFLFLILLSRLIGGGSDESNSHASMVSGVLKGLFFLVVAYIALFLATAMNGSNLRSAYMFYPDQALCLGVIGGSALILSLYNAYRAGINARLKFGTKS